MMVPLPRKWLHVRQARLRPRFFVRWGALLAIVPSILASGSSAAEPDETLSHTLKLNSISPAAADFWLEFSHDGRFLVSAGIDKVVRIWDVTESELAGTLVLKRAVHMYDGGGTSGIVFSARFSPDDRYLAVGTNLGCTILDFKTGQALAHLRFPEKNGSNEPFQTLAFSQDGQYLISGHTRRIRFWSLEPLRNTDPAQLQTPAGRADLAERLHATVEERESNTDGRNGYHFFSLEAIKLPNGHTRVLSTADSQTVEIWDSGPGGWHLEYRVKCESVTLMAAFLADANQIITASEDQILRRWNFTRQSDRIVGRTRTDLFRTPRIAVLDSGRRIALGNWPESRQCAVMNTRSGEIEARFLSHDNQITAIASHPHQNWIATSGSTATRICLWDADDGRLIASTRSSGLTPVAAAYGPDGRSIAFGTELIRSDSLQGDALQGFEATWNWTHFGFGWGLFASQKYIRPLSRAFDVERVEPLVETDLRSNMDFALDSLPNDGGYRRHQLRLDGWAIDRYSDNDVLTKDEDTLIVVRSGRVSRRIRSIDRTRVDAASLVRLDDGKRTGAILASGKGIYLYDIETEEILAEFRGQNGFTNNVAVSSDQKTLLVASQDQVLRLFSLSDRGTPNRKVGIQFRRGTNVVNAIVPLSPVALSGINPGDTILQAGASAIGDVHDLMQVANASGFGQRLRLQVRRKNGKSENITLVPRTIILPLLSIHMAGDGRWVAWTEQGFYTCSPGADDLFGWQVNRGLEQPGDFYAAERFQAALYRPDLVRRFVASHGDPEILPDELGIDALLSTAMPPSIVIESPADAASVSTESIELVARVSSQSNIAVQAIDVRVNGQAVRNVAALPDSRTDERFRKVVNLDPGANRISVQAIGAGGILGEPQVVRVKCTAGSAPEQNEQLPVLHFLAVGVSEYADPTLQLYFAAKDANDLATALRDQTGKRFREVNVRVLTNESATSKAVGSQLEEFQKLDTGPQDFVVVFLSGHGARDDLEDYFFLTADADLENLSDSAIHWSKFYRILQRTNEVSMLLIDTCHAGAISNGRNIAREAQDAYNEVLRKAAMDLSGVITFVSCLPHELSIESSAWENGAFTKSVVEAFAGEGDLNHDGSMTISELEAFVSGRVEELTRRRQSSALFKSISVPSNLKLAVVPDHTQ